MDGKLRWVVLIDTLQDEKFEAIRGAEALGGDLYAVRLDTPSSRRGDFFRIIQEVRWELDIRGYGHVKIIASGGVDEYEILHLNPVVDPTASGRRSPTRPCSTSRSTSWRSRDGPWRSAASGRERRTCFAAARATPPSWFPPGARPLRAHAAKAGNRCCGRSRPTAASSAICHRRARSVTTCWSSSGRYRWTRSAVRPFAGTIDAP